MQQIQKEFMPLQLFSAALGTQLAKVWGKKKALPRMKFEKDFPCAEGWCLLQQLNDGPGKQTETVEGRGDMGIPVGDG